MEPEAGDDYVRRVATFIRSNERALAQPALARRRRQQPKPSSDVLSAFNPLGWLGLDAQSPIKPIIFSIDTHHLFYLLIRLEALGLNVGTLDVKVDNPSRPMSYINFSPDRDKSDTLSLASIRSSFSVVSGLSIGSGWWGRPDPLSLETELKYIFSSFTKLPALSIKAPARKVISELANEPPNENAIPLDAFKNVQSLECVDIDPRALLGWDRLAESLRSLKIRKSGLEDISDVFIGAVVDDQARREGSTSRTRHRRIPRGPLRRTSFYASTLPDSVPEDSEETSDQLQESDRDTSSIPVQLSSLKWAFLKYLSLADNALTFIPSELLPYLTSLIHLDLSSNLLVSVPSGLGTLHNLSSLNLSDNMIDSVLGIYLNLGQVLTLNLSRNRLESICGLERLHALERVDLRGNLIEESAEVGRLATLPNIAEVWIEGNPLCELEEDYRIPCFDFFWKEGKSILLDGSPPGFYEKRNLTVLPPQQMASRPVSAYSPPTVPVGHSHSHSRPESPPIYPDNNISHSPSTSTNASPMLAPVTAVGVGKMPRRKKVKRIVDLDGGEHSDGSSKSANHRRTRSDGVSKDKGKATRASKSKKDRDASPLGATPTQKPWGQFGALLKEHKNLDSESAPTAAISTLPTVVPFLESIAYQRPPIRSRHSRHQTEFAAGSPSADTVDITHSPTFPESPVQPSFRRALGSQTFSSKSTARRARVSASVYEPPGTTTFDGEGGDRIPDEGEFKDDAEAFRRRIEALKKDMGDGWLKVFSQSQMKTPS